MIRILFAFVIAALAALPARAEDAQTKIALRVIDDYLMPRYQAFETATFNEQAAWVKFCKSPAGGGKGPLLDAFNKTSDAWQAVDHIRTGPVSLFLRAERINYWPEMRNATAKGLAALLTSDDPKALEMETFSQGSVAVQGLPALERLLYTDVDLTSPRACAIGEAITENLANVAHEIVASWSAPNGPRNALAEGKTVTGGFADGAEASRLLLTDLMTSFQRMLDMKLLAVLGTDADGAKPKAVENWRSGRAKRNLVIDLQSTDAMIAVFAKDLDSQSLVPLQKAMDEAKADFAALPDDLGNAAADAGQRPLLEKAANAVKAARDLSRAILPPKLNIVLGFNALDGD